MAPVSGCLAFEKIDSVGNHCVVAKCIKEWRGNECLEIENYGGSEETRYIPVDYPLFEEVQIEVMKKVYELKKNENGEDIRTTKGSEAYVEALNRYGKKLCKKKYGNEIEQNWYEVKKRTTKDHDRNVAEKDLLCKYPMLFVRGTLPCFQLKFTS